MDELSRRKFLSWGMGWGALAGQIAGARVFAAVCGVTPPQTQGPYYPQADLDRDSDLTQLTPTSPKALGIEIVITGQVLDTGCRPIPGAKVEIWQAAASGKYNHTDDINPLPPDPNFQYWGRATANSNGEYLFRTVVPGHYPLENGDYRPPHIHFKAHAGGFLSLTTQMYFDHRSFSDSKLADKVKELNDFEHVDPRLIVPFTVLTLGNVSKGTFDITLRKNG